MDQATSTLVSSDHRSTADAVRLLPEDLQAVVPALPEEELRNRNASRETSLPYRPAEVEIQAIRDVLSPTPDQLESWITHPDARVPIALLESPLLHRMGRDQNLPYALALTRRVLRDSKDYVWTPLLDALSRSRLWPQSWEIAKQAGGSIPDRAISSEDEYLETKIAPWARAQKSPASLTAAVRTFGAFRFLYTIAKHAIAVDTTLVDELAARNPYTTCLLAIRARHLPRAVGGRLLEHFVRFAIDSNRSSIFLTETKRFIPSCYEKLQQAGFVLSDDQVQQLFDTVSERIRQAAGVVDAAQGRDLDAALGMLQHYLGLAGDEERVIRYIDLALRAGSAWRVNALLTPANHPTLVVTPAMARAVLERLGATEETCELLVQSPSVRSDPDLRKVLLECDSWVVARNLIDDNVREEFAVLFRKVVDQNPEEALAVLEENGELARATLNRTDLAPLLQSEDHEIRLRAVALLGEFDTSPPVPQRSIR